tara:strand:- start:183 stop:704 length:522 start_codon:yes stop_codon:yes gene_type:complete
MKYKNTESKRTFVPKKIGDTLGKVNRVFSNKYGKIEFLILSKWPQIVGSFFAEHSEPDKISRLTEDFDEYDQPIFKSFLNVRVSPAAAVEFQHYKDTIIEKINSFFGYKAIADLRLQQNFIPKKKNEQTLKSKRFETTDNEKQLVKKEIQDIKDKELENSIVNLGLSINREDT